MPPLDTQAQLDPYYDADFFKRQVVRLAVLPAGLNQLGLVLIGAQRRGEKIDYQAQQKRLRQAYADLARLAPPDRQRLFSALAPSIADAVEAGWQVFDRLPYTSGYNRRPFRLKQPGDTLDANLSRCAWLEQLLLSVSGFDQPVTWFAAWAAYLSWGAADALGYLFAGVIDQGGQAGQDVYEILAASARGDHPTGKMGRHVVRGLLCASRPEGWDLITRLLLAAQREEGLRQVIMEGADEAHPEAFKRLLRVVVEQNLVRFSAVVRAVTVWVGLPLEAADPKAVLAVLARLQAFLDDPALRQAALEAGAAEDQYLALWSLAFEDAACAVAAAQPLLRRAQPEHRFIAASFLGQVQLDGSERSLLPLLDDSDLRVAACAYQGIAARGMDGGWIAESDLFERLERLVQRLPERAKTLKPIVWDWMTLKIERRSVAGSLVKALGNRPPARLLPYLNMTGYEMRAAADLLGAHIHEDPRYRSTLLELAANRDRSIHEYVFTLLKDIQPRPDEISQLEALLARKTASLRRGVMDLLLRQPDGDLLASIDRLLAQRDAQQRLAGIELLRQMLQAGRERGECQARVERLQAGGLSEDETYLLADLLADAPIVYSLKDALGLANLNNLSQPRKPRSQNSLFGLVKKTHLGSSAAAACIEALEALIEQHRADPVQIHDWRGENADRAELLGSVQWGLGSFDPALSMAANRPRFQLAEVWEAWLRERPAAQRDEDGLELLRARAALSLMTMRWTHSSRSIHEVNGEIRTFLDEPYNLKLNYWGLVQYVLDWLIYLHPAPGAVDFLLDAVEEICCRFEQRPALTGLDAANSRHEIRYDRLGYIQLARRCRDMHPEAWTSEHHARFWGLVVWLDQFARQHGGGCRPELGDLLLAYRAGQASQDDLYRYILGEPEKEQSSINGQVIYNPQQFQELRAFSGKQAQPIFADYPVLRTVIDRCRERIVQIELRRGDLPTPASIPALTLRSVPGMETLVHLLVALGKSGFARGQFFFDQNRAAVLSHLIRVSYPLESDTPEAFAALARAAQIPEHRLVELAVFAPQWVRFVEYTLGWAGMSGGVWWLYAHTRDRQWAVDPEIRETWAAQINEHTPLSADDLMDGAVDVAWFHRVYAVLGEARWQAIYQAALFAASGAGHARARLFADAMLGAASASDLTQRIRAKRHQDAVRALGLVPLPEDDARQAEILRRYEVMQAFLRGSKQFGPQRQASEKLSVSIGMENLARTAGYADPQRLEWAMELAAVADLAQGPVVVESGGVTLTLAINDLGEPEFAIRRGEKALKTLPPAVKKDETVAALVERKSALEQQTRRMRASLETAMTRGDLFSASEIQALFGHPILRVMLEQLVFTGPAGMGYPVENGSALDALGTPLPLAAEDCLRIAHPYDLLQSGRWHDWQHECFVAERVQPFKQVFRELYVLTDTEREDDGLGHGNLSRRYAGQQVNPRQALALFGSRGWVAAPEEGVFKTFHAEGIVARVGFLQTVYTPAEVEGLTLETAAFTRRGEGQPLQLEQVPPRLFSEVMRDLDLVVSVAHAGGVDPEASASTVESRAALVEETCALLQIANVRVEARHALVDGALGHYTIHLSSGTVHKQPGGALCIIPVHSQQRGRLFLPFVDHDPKTAEIVSKVLLLAKDQAIKDPTILEQILR